MFAKKFDAKSLELFCIDCDKYIVAGKYQQLLTIDSTLARDETGGLKMKQTFKIETEICLPNSNNSIVEFKRNDCDGYVNTGNNIKQFEQANEHPKIIHDGDNISDSDDMTSFDESIFNHDVNNCNSNYNHNNNNNNNYNVAGSEHSDHSKQSKQSTQSKQSKKSQQESFSLLVSNPKQSHDQNHQSQRKYNDNSDRDSDNDHNVSTQSMDTIITPQTGTETITTTSSVGATSAESITISMSARSISQSQTPSQKQSSYNNNYNNRQREQEFEEKTPRYVYPYQQPDTPGYLKRRREIYEREKKLGALRLSSPASDYSYNESNEMKNVNIIPDNNNNNHGNNNNRAGDMDRQSQSRSRPRRSPSRSQSKSQYRGQRRNGTRNRRRNDVTSPQYQFKCSYNHNSQFQSFRNGVQFQQNCSFNTQITSHGGNNYHNTFDNNNNNNYNKNKNKNNNKSYGKYNKKRRNYSRNYRQRSQSPNKYKGRPHARKTSLEMGNTGNTFFNQGKTWSNKGLADGLLTKIGNIIKEEYIKLSKQSSEAQTLFESKRLCVESQLTNANSNSNSLATNPNESNDNYNHDPNYGSNVIQNDYKNDDNKNNQNENDNDTDNDKENDCDIKQEEKENKNNNDEKREVEPILFGYVPIQKLEIQVKNHLKQRQNSLKYENKVYQTFCPKDFNCVNFQQFFEKYFNNIWYVCDLPQYLIEKNGILTPFQNNYNYNYNCNNQMYDEYQDKALIKDKSMKYNRSKYYATVEKLKCKKYVISAENKRTINENFKILFADDDDDDDNDQIDIDEEICFYQEFINNFEEFHIFGAELDIDRDNHVLSTSYSQARYLYLQLFKYEKLMNQTANVVRHMKAKHIIQQMKLVYVEIRNDLIDMIKKLTFNYRRRYGRELSLQYIDDV